ncbi:hypothetical protein CCHR01_14115 [Colletotrichum chrysophilum]|uniref:Uncharacterized protein n=1 Tax=Colletotrichum chrysophilum TaxID=1836956 RepID=A0AAD9E9V3_9PEZI|nr:hypothetical protein CCHR01_14115 [Colletotrichum chrysophilum]
MLHDPSPTASAQQPMILVFVRLSAAAKDGKADAKFTAPCRASPSPSSRLPYSGTLQQGRQLVTFGGRRCLQRPAPHLRKGEKSHTTLTLRSERQAQDARMLRVGYRPTSFVSSVAKPAKSTPGPSPSIGHHRPSEFAVNLNYAHTTHRMAVACHSPDSKIIVVLNSSASVVPRPVAAAVPNKQPGQYSCAAEWTADCGLRCVNREAGCPPPGDGTTTGSTEAGDHGNIRELGLVWTRISLSGPNRIAALAESLGQLSSAIVESVTRKNYPTALEAHFQARANADASVKASAAVPVHLSNRSSAVTGTEAQVRTAPGLRSDRQSARLESAHQGTDQSQPAASVRVFAHQNTR